MADLDPLSAKQIAQREEMGDVLSRARPVDHTVLFARRGAARAAGTDLETLGFTVTTERRGLLGAVVRATREDAVDPDAVASFLREVRAVASRHGGTYDGWGGPVVPG